MFLLGILIHWNFDRLRSWLEGKFLPYLLGYAAFMILLVTLVDHRSLPFYLAYLPSRTLLALANIAAVYSARSLSGETARRDGYLIRNLYLSLHHHQRDDPARLDGFLRRGDRGFRGVHRPRAAELASRGETRAGLQGGLATGAVEPFQTAGAGELTGTASHTCRQPGKLHLFGNPAHCSGFTGWMRQVSPSSMMQ